MSNLPEISTNKITACSHNLPNSKDVAVDVDVLVNKFFFQVADLTVHA